MSSYDLLNPEQKEAVLHTEGPLLILAGAGSGKTKSIGKPLMEQYIRSGFAGFIYDFKDFAIPGLHTT